jgi:hypothetical protein
MKLQLTVLSLVFIAALLIRELSALTNPGPQPRRGRAREGDIMSRLGEALVDGLPAYVLLAVIGVVMFSFGKPERLPQYAGWAVVVLQILRGLLVMAGESRSPKRVAGILSLICLAYLWILQLPIFTTLPY